MKLYLTRHGQTKWTVKKIVCGRTDCSLTEDGCKQAAQLGKKIENLGIDLIYSSPLRRAVKTAEIIAKFTNVPVILDDRLIEQSYGKYENGSKEDPEFVDMWQHLPVSFGGGESSLRVAQRVYNCLDEIINKNADKKVLIVAHGGVCKLVKSYFVDMTNEEFIRFNMGNCDLEEFNT